MYPCHVSSVTICMIFGVAVLQASIAGQITLKRFAFDPNRIGIHRKRVVCFTSVRRWIMGKAYSLDLREQICAYVSRGHSARAAGRVFGVSAATAVRFAAEHRARGTVVPKGYLFFSPLRPDVMLRHLKIPDQNIGRLPAPCPHDGCRVMARAEQILRRTHPHGMPAEGVNEFLL